MRFHFCGGLEPPDWLLAEVPLLAQLSPSATSGLCASISRDIAAAPGHAAEQAAELLPIDGDREGDSDGEGSAARAVVAALRFVLVSAAKYNVDERGLRLELQQLGLDAALSAAVAQELEASRGRLREQQRELRWAFAHPDKTACAVRRPPEATQPVVEVRMRLSEPATELTGASQQSEVEAFVVGADKFLALEEDLRRALSTLQGVRL